MGILARKQAERDELTGRLAVSPSSFPGSVRTAVETGRQRAHSRPSWRLGLITQIFLTRRSSVIFSCGTFFRLSDPRLQVEWHATPCCSCSALEYAMQCPMTCPVRYAESRPAPPLL